MTIVRALRIFAGVLIALVAQRSEAADLATSVMVSIADQELAFVSRNRIIARYPISSSKFGIGDNIGSFRTPVGTLFVSGKFGDGLPAGAVIKSRVPTNEILSVDAPSRDAIVSRVIWLRGMEEHNRRARDRCIYIHGTPEEKRIGRRASFGCIRMRSKDIIALYPLLHIGTHVTISEKTLSELLPNEEPSLLARSD